MEAVSPSPKRLPVSGPRSLFKEGVLRMFAECQDPKVQLLALARNSREEGLEADLTCFC